MPYRSTKTYGHDLGLSACFRQWRATHSHCSLLHGYALSFRFEFEATHLDDKNWVMDFGNLKGLKKRLVDTFDHKLVVAEDDPQLDYISSLSGLGIADVLVLRDGVGCEMFAKLAYDFAVQALTEQHMYYRIRVASVECAEHGANSAIYIP